MSAPGSLGSPLNVTLGLFTLKKWADCVLNPQPQQHMAKLTVVFSGK